MTLGFGHGGNFFWCHARHDQSPKAMLKMERGFNNGVHDVVGHRAFVGKACGDGVHIGTFDLDLIMVCVLIYFYLKIKRHCSHPGPDRFERPGSQSSFAGTALFLAFNALAFSIMGRGFNFREQAKIHIHGLKGFFTASTL